jgi:hypothetical protein
VTGDAFPRFVLLVGCTAYAVGLGLVAIFLGSWLAVGGFVAGVIGAMILTVDVEPAASKPKDVAVVAQAEGLSRLEIARHAREADRGERDE